MHKHNQMKEIEESGFAALLVFVMPYPPSERAAKIIDHCGIKNSQISGSLRRVDPGPPPPDGGAGGNELASLKRETRFAAGFPIAFHRN